MVRRGREVCWLATGLSVCGLLMLWPATAAAQEESTVVVYTENDDWWPDTGTDKNYTNALRLTVDRNFDTWRLRRVSWLRWIPDHPDCAKLVAGDAPDTKCVSSTVEVGQQFYTPDDISVSTLIPNDRPYAGWLYVGGSWRSTTESTMVSTHLYLGTTGRWSLAKPVQTIWHDLVNATTPMGWSHQIGNRAGLALVHTRHWAFDAELGGRRVVDVTPAVGFTAGNIMTDGYAGGRIKAGWNIARDWSPAGIGPRVPTRNPAGFEVFATADAQARVLAYSAFIDAAPQHDLGRNYGVWDAAWGFGFRAGWFGLMYRVAYISPEYDEAKVHDYKSIRLSFRVAGCRCP
jgi:hypothetical protein